jgi:hypothetical protein
MCKWGTNVELRVPIQAELSHTGRERWAIKKIDACIAPIVDALNKGGVLTTACCCGHGKANGEIHLQDGRVLTIHAPNKKVKFRTPQGAGYLPESK